MSSTNRGGVREASDYYVTPQWAILDFMRAFAPHGPAFDLTGANTSILDPCAGGDEKRGMAYPEAVHSLPEWKDVKIETVDIRQDSRAHIKCVDYLGFTGMEGVYSLIITNPPFALAMPIIEKALRDVKPEGRVVMLLRLNFFGGTTEKKAFFDRVGLPLAVYVHRKRMRFMPKGAINPATGKPFTSDSVEYAHFVWKPGLHPEFTKLRVI